eukprot:gene6458-6957_t
MRSQVLLASSLRHLSCAIGAKYSFSTSTSFDLFNPTPEHSALRQLVRSFAETEVEAQALEFNRSETFNLPLFRKLGGLGLLGVNIDPAYGGSGMDATAAVIATEELASADPAFCVSYSVHSALFANNLQINGNDEQRQRFLPRACAGDVIGGIAMTEPHAGTDVFGMKTFAKPSADGRHFLLTGTKLYITNGTLDGKTTGDVFIVYAKTDNTAKDGGLTSFLVEKGMPGFSLGQKIEDKCGMRASPTAELVFEDVRVPRENIVGEQGGAALCLMRNFEIERLCIAAASLGIARRSVEVMSAYAQQRRAFGQPIANFGQVQKAIAESYAEFMAGRSYVYDVARRLDLRSYGNGLDADGVKLFAAPMAKRVADRAIQVLGGNGYVGEYVVERLWRDSRLLEIAGGTNEAHHKNMMRDIKRLRGRIE